jgi:hypothetical protein
LVVSKGTYARPHLHPILDATDLLDVPVSGVEADATA